MALGLILAACATAPDERAIIGTRHVIREIRFVGVHRFDEDELLRYTHMAQTGWWPFATRYYYNEALLPVDRRNIEALYRAYGYHEAQVVAVRTDFDGDEVDLTIEVQEGLPVRVKSVRFDWPEGPPKGEPEREATAPRTITGKASVEVDQPFEVPRLNASTNDMRNALLNRGYALAEVGDSALVNRDERTAELDFSLRPGPLARVGDIRFEGLRMAPESLVRNEIDYAPGARFSPTLMERIEKSVYALDVFRAVTVLPADHMDEEGRLGVTVRVTEADPQSLKLGVGLGFEPTRWEERLTLLYSNRDFLVDLGRLDLEARVGYAQLPTALERIEQGPILLLEPTFRKKGWLEKRIVWTARPSFELGVEEGYAFWTTRGRVGASRFFLRRIETDLSYNARYLDFYRFMDAFRANRTLLGRDFRDPYVLSYGEAILRWHLTDDLLEPRNGVVIGATYDLAGGALGGDYSFHELTPELRAYWKPLSWLQLAGRAEVGFIQAYGPEGGAPIDLKYYLGGADTVRGWGLRRLAPRVQECPPDEDCRSFPVGGSTMVLGSLEARFRLSERFILATFFDTGDVQDAERTIRPEEWNRAAGTGLRVDTPVGLFRGDVGWRLNDTPLSEGEPRWAVHLGLGHTF